MNAPSVYRSIWLSDFHLGTRDSRADLILDFLRETDSEFLYLVGDIVDGWALSRSWYWHQHHNDVIQKILRKARKGTTVVYIPGNHDEFARAFCDARFGDIVIRPNHVHVTSDGRRLLVLHGDEFDGAIGRAKWLYLLGASAYQYCLRLNRVFNQARRRLGLPYWSLSAYLKHRTKQAIQFMADFEQVVEIEARRRNVDGIVCGHIHHAELRTQNGITYANTGDWVESCTALVEHHDGRLELIRWATIGHDSQAAAQVASGDGYSLSRDRIRLTPSSVLPQFVGF